MKKVLNTGYKWEYQETVHSPFNLYFAPFLVRTVMKHNQEGYKAFIFSLPSELRIEPTWTFVNDQQEHSLPSGLSFTSGSAKRQFSASK